MCINTGYQLQPAIEVYAEYSVFIKEGYELRGPIAIFGADGYIGWALAIHLGVTTNETIVLVDNFATRRLVASVHSDSLVPISSMQERIKAYTEQFGKDNLVFVPADARDIEQVDRIIADYKPQNIVHLAQQRSAPFSMIDQEHVLYTQLSNVATNLNILFSMARHVPGGHLLKMGSMGEYGTPGVEIKEGDVELKIKGRRARVMFPRSGGSWYHLSKVFDTFNVLLANKVFDIRATDVMQGVVYGTKVDEIVEDRLNTRFDFDSIWGTVINKYVVQAVVLNELLIYGKGRQKRGFLSLYDSVNCLSLLLDNPPKEGEYRVVNQLDEIYDTVQLAERVLSIAGEFGIKPKINWIENPRVESEDHFYAVEHKILPQLGFRRKKDIDTVLREIFEAVIVNKRRAEEMKHLIYPTVDWRQGKNKSSKLFQMPKELMHVQTQEELLPLASELTIPERLAKER